MTFIVSKRSKFLSTSLNSELGSKAGVGDVQTYDKIAECCNVSVKIHVSFVIKNNVELAHKAGRSKIKNSRKFVNLIKQSVGCNPI